MNPMAPFLRPLSLDFAGVKGPAPASVPVVAAAAEAPAAMRSLSLSMPWPDPNRRRVAPGVCNRRRCGGDRQSRPRRARRRRGRPGGRRGAARRSGDRRDGGERCDRGAPRGLRRAGVRRVDGIRLARDDADSGGPPSRSPAVPDPLARGRRRAAGGARGGPGHDGAESPLARVRLLGRSSRGRGRDRGAAERRHHPGRARARVAGGQRRSRSARALRAGDDGGGRGLRTGGRTRAGHRRAPGSRHRARDAEGKGGSRAHQRDRRDPRHARPGDRGPGAAAPGRRPYGGDVRRGAHGDGPRLRARPDRASSASGPGFERRQHVPAAGRLCDRRIASLRRPAGPGRLLAALRAAGERRGSRRAGGRATGPRMPSSPQRSTIR